MRKILFFPMVFALGLGLGACSGGDVFPVAQNGPTDSGPGSTPESGNSDGSTTEDGAAQQDGGGCSGDGGGVSCLCGSPVCVAGQWTCGSCNNDGGGDSGVPGCNPPCDPGSVCVGDQIVGGGIVPVSDAGTCPPGRHPNGDRCDLDPTFSCMLTPVPCAPLTCSCASVLCTSQQTCAYHCDSVAAGQVNCLCQVP